MAKRFIDTGFMDQKWIRKLSPEKKIFLIYLMLKCDNGGIIELDLEDASFWIGKEIKTLNFLPKDYLIPLNDSGKFFMPKFIEWQYKDLTSNKYIVAQARQILVKHGLINDDFTLNLHKYYVNVTQNLCNSQEIGIGIGIGIGNEETTKLSSSDETIKNNEANESVSYSVTDIKNKNKKTGKHLFKNSEYYDNLPLIEKDIGIKYHEYNLYYYHETMKNWADSKGMMYVDWIACLRGFILRDIKNGDVRYAKKNR